MPEALKHINEAIAVSAEGVEAMKHEASEETLDKRRAAIANRLYTIIVIITVVVMFLFVGMVVLAVTVTDLKGSIDDTLKSSALNREVGYKNGANQCVVIVALGSTKTDYCSDPEVTKYYDENQAPGVPASKATIAAAASVAEGNRKLCTIELKLGIPDTACVPPATVEP